MKRDICRSLSLVLAMLLMRVASTESSWYGFADRVIQAIVATALTYFAIRTVATKHTANTPEGN